MRTAWERLVADYAGATLMQVGSMPYVHYLMLRRDAYIAALRATREGREYLDDAKRLAQTDFDSNGMRSTFGVTNGG